MTGRRRSHQVSEPDVGGRDEGIGDVLLLLFTTHPLA
jgi:hypothetical protein